MSQAIRTEKFRGGTDLTRYRFPLQLGNNTGIDPYRTLHSFAYALSPVSCAQAAPDNAGVFALLGRCRMAAGDAVGAQPPLDRATQLRPEDGPTAVRLAQARCCLSLCSKAKGRPMQRYWHTSEEDTERGSEQTRATLSLRNDHWASKLWCHERHVRV